MPFKKLSVLIIGAVLFLSGVVFTQPSNPYLFWGERDLGVPFTVFNSSGQHYIGVKGDTVYVVSSNGWTWCQKSTDGGKSFGAPVRVNSTSAGYNPSMRVDTAGVVYVAYQSGEADIYFSKSTDGGITFTPGVKVNDDTIPQTGQEKPAIAVNNKGQVFIAWRDQRNSAPQTHQTIFAAASYNGGLIFTANVRVNEENGGSGLGDIAADDSGQIYVAYAGIAGGQRGIVLARSSDSGKTFTQHTLASDPPWDGAPPSMSISSSGLIGLAWLGSRISGDSLLATLRFSISADYGGTFSPSIRVDDDSDLSSRTSPQAPSLVWRNGVFYLVWRDPRFPDEGDHISFSFSSDTGQSFAPNVNVTPFYTARLFPSLAVNEEGRAFVAWLDPRHDLSHGLNYHVFTAVGDTVPEKGDLNLDGWLTAVDVILELNAVFLMEPFPAPFRSADANCDGMLTVADAVLHLNATFLGEPFPCN